MTGEGPARSQSDVVVDGIRRLIAGGALGPGDRLPVEKDLAAQLGVSRGSLREGVRALAVLGVLETRQGAGTYVTSLEARLLSGPLGLLADLQGPADSVHLLGVRRLLEGETAARAAARLSAAELASLGAILDRVDALISEHGSDVDMDEFIEADIEFHRIVARASGNPALAALTESLGGRTLRARVWRAISDRGAIAATQAEHRAILAELRRRDPERARVRMAAHVLGVEDFVDDQRDAATDAQ